MMELWPSKWYCVIWGILGFLTLLSGVISRNIVTVTFGAAFTFSATSAYLITYVKSEHRIKRILEVVSVSAALGIFIYGYATTGNLILGAMTLFIVAMVFFAFVVSYLLPRIRSKSSERGVV